MAYYLFSKSLPPFSKKLTTFFQKAYYLFWKSILPFGKEVGLYGNVVAVNSPLKQCLNAVLIAFKRCFKRDN